MIDVTGPKVLVPTILFALLSPGLAVKFPPDAGFLTQTLFHSLLFSIISWAIIKFVFKFTITQADLVVPALLFILLTPGILLSIPSDGAGMFFSGKTGITQIITHAIVFSIVFAATRGLFPQIF